MAVGITPSSVAAFLKAQVPRRRVEGAKLNEGWQLFHVNNVDENGSSSAEFFAFAFDAGL